MSNNTEIDINDFTLSELDVVLHKILKQARELLNAQGGTIYLKDKENLRFQIFQNDALSYGDIYSCYSSYKDLKLPMEKEGVYLAVDSFLKKEVISVDDVYKSEQYEFLGVKEFDSKFNYKTKSIITIPLIDTFENKVLGVLQLLNKEEESNFVPFSLKDKETLLMLSSYITLLINQTYNSNKKLEVLNKELNEANKKLKENFEYEKIQNKKKSAIIFHQSKMASMGEMIGSIAHKWRQPLNKISTLSSGIKLAVELDNFQKDMTIVSLNDIINTTKKLSKTIDEFRSFYHVENVKENFNLSNSIYRSIDIAQGEMRSNSIQVITNLDDTLMTFGLKNEFTQCILNILNNAKDALVEKVNYNDNRYIFVNLFKENDNIYLNIKDNALGISKDIETSIFNEYFSTKKDINSIGMGLYITKLIIEEEFKGKIYFKNISYTFNGKKYKGAEFTIKL